MSVSSLYDTTFLVYRKWSSVKYKPKSDRNIVNMDKLVTFF